MRVISGSTSQGSKSSGGGLMAYPDRGWHRLLFKAPINLWRLGLGPLIGHILMIITHKGRKSGLPRRTMVEYHKHDGTIYAPCAFGPRSDWYRNIAADPRVTVQTAVGTQSMIAARVTADKEILSVYALFRRRDPPLLKWYLHSLDIEDNQEDVLNNKDRIYWIRFDPTDEPTPPHLEVDLLWVWPIFFISLFALWRLRSLKLLLSRRESRI